MTGASALVALAVSIAATGTAWADTYAVYYASGVFQDGTKLSGTVTADVTTNSVTAVDLTTTGPHAYHLNNFTGGVYPIEGLYAIGASSFTSGVTGGSVILYFPVSSFASYTGGPIDAAPTFFYSSKLFVSKNDVGSIDYFVSGSLSGSCGAACAPGIFWGNTNITGTVQQAVVGQQITLTGQPTNGQWTSPPSTVNATIGNFALAGCVHDSVGNTLLPCASQLTPSDFTQPMATFYWYVPSDGGYEVDYTYPTGGGSSQTLTATFKVTGPKPAVIDTTIHNIEGPYWLPGGKIPNLWIGAFMGLGKNDHIVEDQGIKFFAWPSLLDNGNLEWIQTLNLYLVSHYKVTGGPPHHPNVNIGVDSGVPSHSVTDKNGVIVVNQHVDAPSVQLCWNDTGVTAIEHFSTYLFWKSSGPGSNFIYVPLGHVNWSWQAGAGHGPFDWQVTPGQRNYKFYPLASDISLDFPSWNTIASAPQNGCE